VLRKNLIINYEFRIHNVSSSSLQEDTFHACYERIDSNLGLAVRALDLEKIGYLIQQANEKSSKFNLKDMLKGLKKLPHNSTSNNGKNPIHNTAEDKSSET
jgi:hypothetical protein